MKKRFLVAVSGGPDSMALLDMQRKKNNYLEVAHVNYHLRQSALRDEKIVRAYCKKYAIKFHKLDFDKNKYHGNFQANARIARYSFFADLCKKNKLELVLVAHHLDDNIETYIMQVTKQLRVAHFGIAESSYLYGVNVYRPLLGYTKDDLIKYCEENNITYGIDESNLTDAYERNRVRHSKVERLTMEEKMKLVKEINNKNDENAKHFHEAITYIGDRESFEVDEFLKIPYIKEFLRKFFTGKSDKYFDEMLRQLKEAKSCKYISPNKCFYVVKEYDHINFFMRPNDYMYKLNKLDDLKTKKYDHFKLAKRGNSVQGVTLSKSDFPIIIRNVRKDDSIEMTYGTKKLSRFFIDNKICLKDRISWPIMINKKGSAILVPNLGCDKDHYSQKHNLFMIKL